MTRAKMLWNNVFILTFAGGIAFWLANFAISRTAIAAEYRAAMSIAYYPMLFESLIGGLVIGLWVSYSLLHFYDRVPTKYAFQKSIIVSSVVFFIVTILPGNPSSYYATSNIWRYFIIGTVINLIRIYVLGIAIGYVCKKYYVETQLTGQSKVQGTGETLKQARTSRG